MKCYAITSHRFFCPRCGMENVPLFRKKSKIKEKFHHKKLYCYKCNKTLNLIECRNEEEVKEFKEKFLNGEFKEDGDNIYYDWSTGKWKDYLL